jgi:hypothetical protein
MPRIRTIKPQFWLDENLGTIPRDARLMYIGLWNLSDDTGIFQWRPLQIKAQIFPYDYDITEDNINNWLQNLIDTSDIEKFEYNGKWYGRINSFLDHQDIKNPSKWTFLETNGKKKTLPQSYPSTTPALPVGKKKRVIGKKKRVIGKELEEKFNRFWDVYPKKKSKGQAKSVFYRINPAEQLLATMLAKIEQAKKSDDWVKEGGKFIPYPATWLNAEGWEDEISTSQKVNKWG